MQILTLPDGREFRFALDLDTVDYIRDTVKAADGRPVDLLDIVDQDFQDDGAPDLLLNKLQKDRRLLADVVYAAISANDSVQLSRKDFRRQCKPEVLEQLSELLVQEIIQLFPHPRRSTVQQLWEQQRLIQDQLQAAVRETDLQATETILKIIHQPNLLALLSGELPENSDSTPENSPSAN